tara:strand:+ start:17728 stop:19704 length:1977 start_codon:yes stop_codon:yes gene_type:complete
MADGAGKVTADMEIFPVPQQFAREGTLSSADYDRLYAQSVNDPETFWREEALERLDWIKPFTIVKNTSFEYPTVSIKWFEDGVLNVCANCVDRHLEKQSHETAIIWQGDEPHTSKRITYSELHKEVQIFANVLKARGVGKGDRVILYMPMIPEAAYAMLACARIGAVHSVVFAGFSADALADRINDCGAKLVVTADTAPRGGRHTALKAHMDEALTKCDPSVKTLVVRRTGDEIAWFKERDAWYHELAVTVPLKCDPEPMNAEDPLFILYTSGSTGKPKGVLHTTGGYLVWASMTHEYVFDYRQGDIYWCTADVGWVTGHTYIVYGPLANGAKTIMFEGIPTYPDAGRFWKICEKYKVNVFYTAPTAIRALMGKGNEYVEKHDLSSLRVLGSVGEPINPEAWHWYNTVVGKEKCPIVDTWWQTETGGAMITPLPGATPLKPGSATNPFFGVQLEVLDTEGKVVEGNGVSGVLAIKDSWPGQMRTVYGDHDRFVSTYFETFKGYYFTSDGCRRDEDGYYWITGRVDDVINVSGHRMGTAEVESALVAHPQVSEAAVVGYPHDIKGQGIYCYVTLMEGEEPTEDLRKELRDWVGHEIGPIAKPDVIQWAPGLPKTRSGKIMRRILRKIAEDECSALGDTSTLADPSVVDGLITNRQNRKT